MAEQLELPVLTNIKPVGAEWFVQLVCEINGAMRVLLLMLLLRLWHVKNEVVHSKPTPPVEVSTRFLTGYLSSLYPL